MNFLNTPQKKKAAVLTALTALFLLLLFFILGLRYLDPPIAYGMEVNFGMHSTGRGPTPSETIPEAKPIPVEEVEEKQEEKTSPPPPQESTPIKEEVLTEKESEVPIVEEQKQPEQQQEIEEETPIEEKQPPKPKVSEATKNLVSNLIQKEEPNPGTNTPGEGIENETGDQGKPDGNPYATSYYNQEGQGGQGTRFGLNGRNLQSDGKVVQQCNQEGTVVVRITVDQNGDVVRAEPGVRGSTNTHPCLLEPAKKTALLHKWHPDVKAPKRQIGFVVIQFKLGE
ncbi:MAG: energy transducer TonB [Flavobacteriaceae bacterium]|jgi:outer membrane biosynthesis protein TonB